MADVFLITFAKILLNFDFKLDEKVVLKILCYFLESDSDRNLSMICSDNKSDPNMMTSLAFFPH